MKKQAFAAALLALQVFPVLAGTSPGDTAWKPVADVRGNYIAAQFDEIKSHSDDHVTFWTRTALSRDEAKRMKGAVYLVQQWSGQCGPAKGAITASLWSIYNRQGLMIASGQEATTLSMQADSYGASLLAQACKAAG